ncbi:TetR/AcrR family transcriptional regulator [Streptomyces sp. NPDC055189]
MARVSQEHLDARRRQILDGAARCFARNGFHATSMQDVLKEVGLSAGAVYRYFRGKEELIGVIVGEALERLRETFEGAGKETPPPPPDVLVGRALTQVMGQQPGAQDGEVAYFPRLMVQVWAETLRSEELAAVMRQGFGEVRVAWVRIVEGYQAAGMMRDDVPAERVARVMAATAQGFAAQLALFDEVPVKALQDGLRGLMSMGKPSS